MMVAWFMPENPARTISSAGTLPPMATAIPLYERNCTLLI